MATTGWTMPQKVAQNYNKKINNGRTCYKYNTLNDILINDTKHKAKFPYDLGKHYGINKDHAGPIIYAYNYNFKIPENAKIEKIQVKPVIRQWTGKDHGGISLSKYKTLKLKMSASTTDTGVGNNKPPTITENGKTEPKNIRYVSAAEDKAGRGWQEDIISHTPEEWGVKTIKPSQINNQNFGVIFQATGTSTRWVDSQVAKLLVKIDYTSPAKKNTQKQEYTINAIATSSTLWIDPVNQTYPGEFDLTIQVDHKGEGGESPIIQLKSDDLYIKAGNKKLTNYTMTSRKMRTSTEKTSYRSTVKILPKQKIGECKLEITHNGKTGDITVNGDKNKHPPVIVNVRYGRMDKLNDSNPEEKALKDKYRDLYGSKDQGCILKNNLFKNNKAADGGAVNITSKYYIEEENTYKNNGYICRDTPVGKVLYWTMNHNMNANGEEYHRYEGLEAQEGPAANGNRIERREEEQLKQNPEDYERWLRVTFPTQFNYEDQIEKESKLSMYQYQQEQAVKKAVEEMTQAKQKWEQTGKQEDKEVYERLKKEVDKYDKQLVDKVMLNEKIKKILDEEEEYKRAVAEEDKRYREYLQKVEEYTSVPEDNVPAKQKAEEEKDAAFNRWTSAKEETQAIKNRYNEKMLLTG